MLLCFGSDLGTCRLLEKQTILDPIKADCFVMFEAECCVLNVSILQMDGTDLGPYLRKGYDRKMMKDALANECGI